MVDQVAAESIAEEIGIEPGDTVISINGHPLTDILDYNFFVNDPLLNINLIKKNGECWELILKGL